MINYTKKIYLPIISQVQKNTIKILTNLAVQYLINNSKIQNKTALVINLLMAPEEAKEKNHSENMPKVTMAII